MYDTICTYPLPSELFAQAIHPSLPVIGVGLASGHVRALRLPTLGSSASNSSQSGAAGGEDDEDEGEGSRSNTPSDGKGMVETAWQTRRHKGSCRALAFSTDGNSLVSAGSEGIVKVADTESGAVRWKIRVPPDEEERNGPSAPSLLHILSPQTLLLATDTSALHLYDFRTPAQVDVSPRPQATFRPHDDYISSLTPLPPSGTSTSGFSKQWVSTGGSTLAVTDLRKGVLARSEDQEQELLSSVFVTGLAKRGTGQGEKVVVGSGNGVISLWEKGFWGNQSERIFVDGGKGGGESLDVIVEVPGGVKGSKGVAVGMGNGKVRFLALGKNKILGEVSHDDLEGVVGLGFEPEGRLVSGGGSVVKVWEESWTGGNFGMPNGVTKRLADSDSEDSDESDEDSDEDEKEHKKRRKRKRGKGKDKSGGKSGLPTFKGLD